MIGHYVLMAILVVYFSGVQAFLMFAFVVPWHERHTKLGLAYFWLSFLMPGVGVLAIPFYVAGERASLRSQQPVDCQPQALELPFAND